MSTPLRVLIVEDSENDTLLIVDELRDGGYDPIYQRVETREQLKAALEQHKWDMIIADYRLPNFNGVEALEMVCENQEDCPFIIVSGQISEETAVDAMRAGAKDYIRKENLKRLVPAIERELREAEVRRQRRTAEEELRQREALLQTIQNSLSAQIAVLDKAGTIIAVNEAWESSARANGDTELKYTGVGVNYLDVCGRALAQGDQTAKEPLEGIRSVLEASAGNFEMEYPFPGQDQEQWFYMRVTPLRSKTGGAVVVHLDVTERKRAEDALEQALEESLNESGRARALEMIAEAGITTTDMQELLDTLVARIIEVLGVHSCSIWMLDEKTGEFVGKAERGAPGVVESRLPVTEGVSGIIYRERRPVFTGDAEHDPIVLDESQEKQGIKSLLSVPLITRDKVVGMTRIDEKIEREFSREEVGLMVAMASRAAQAIENIKLYDALTRSRLELEGALERERSFSLLLQRALLPEEPSINHGYDVAVQYIPYYMGREIGGDFYDVFEIAGGKAGVVIGDVSGKGLEAASLAAATRSTIHAIIHETGSSGEALKRANSILCKRQFTFETQFVTVFVTVIDLETGEFNYASAGHPPAALRKADGTVRFLKPDFQPPICLLPETVYPESRDHIAPGDVLLLFTDGIAEARRKLDLFDLDGIEQVLRKHGHLSVDDIAGELIAAASNWAEGQFSDDAAVVVVKRQG